MAHYFYRVYDFFKTSAIHIKKNTNQKHHGVSISLPLSLPLSSVMSYIPKQNYQRPLYKITSTSHIPPHHSSIPYPSPFHPRTTTTSHNPHLSPPPLPRTPQIPFHDPPLFPQPATRGFALALHRHAAVLVAGGQVVEGRGHEPELAFEVGVFRLEGWGVGGLGLLVWMDLAGWVLWGLRLGGKGIICWVGGL